MSIGLASFPDNIYTTVMPYIKTAFYNIVMQRLDKCHWVGSSVVGNRNISTSFRSGFNLADNIFDYLIFLTAERIEHCSYISFPFVRQDVSSADG